MAYSPATHGCGASRSAALIERIADRVTKSIRHMDVITHDPEAQRIKRLILEACHESLALAIPSADAATTHVTTDKDIQFRVEGVGQVKGAKVVQEAQPAPHFGICAVCSSLHDPRGTYDHAPEPLRRTG